MFSMSVIVCYFLLVIAEADVRGRRDGSLSVCGSAFHFPHFSLILFFGKTLLVPPFAAVVFTYFSSHLLLALFQSRQHSSSFPNSVSSLILSICTNVAA